MRIKIVIAAMIISVVLAGLFLSTSFAAKKGTIDAVTASAGVLASLSQKGLIQISPGDISMFILVEPLWWKGLSHGQKANLVNAAITVARTERKPPKFIIVQDMTERKTLAKGFVDSGEVEISK